MTAAMQESTPAPTRRNPAEGGSLRPVPVANRHVHTGIPPADEKPDGGCPARHHHPGIGQSGCCTRAAIVSRNRDRVEVRAAAMREFDLEERLRNWGNERRGPYDPVDARIVDAAWRRLPVRHRELLQMVYLWKAGREVVCRRLKIRRHAAQFFELELAAAKAALKKIIDS